jgi:transposase
MSTPLTDNLTTKSATNGHTSSASLRPDPQVQPRPPRRRFTAAYKLRILKEADACTQPGELGALLRREGLYSSTLANFRKLRATGKLAEKNAAPAQTRQAREAARQRDARRIAALEAENQKLRVLLDLQKKVATLLDLSLAETKSE